MANYHMIAMQTDAATLMLLQSSEDNTLGQSISNIIQDHNWDMRLPRKGVDKPLPKPIPIQLQDKVIGHYLGHHYDGSPTGVSTQAPLAPSNTVVFTISDSNFDSLGRARGKTIAVLLQEFLKSGDLKKAREATQNEIWEGHSKENPYTLALLLHNDTTQPVPIYALKVWTFHPGDELLMENRGGMPCLLPADYVSPRRASEIRMPLAVPAQTPTHPEP